MNIHHTKLIVGILTSMRTTQRLDGNKKSFQRLQRELIRIGGISYLFSPSSISNSNIEGALFLPNRNKWTSSTFPYPKVVYNRIPFREEEQTNEFQHLITILQNKKIPYFNSQFFYKDKLFSLFDHKIYPFIPETIIPESKLHMMKFIQKHKRIYCKPSNLSQGEGIFTLTYFTTNTVIQRNMNNIETILHIDDLYPTIIQNHYILQRAIRRSTYNGNPYDLRVLVHFINHTFTISGIGVRLSKKQSITTHIRHGGTIIPTDIIPINREIVQYIVQKCGEKLQKEYKNIYEFSLDIGIEDENYYLFEINSKPMIFDEPHIKERGMKNLIQIFKELAP